MKDMIERFREAMAENKRLRMAVLGGVALVILLLLFRTGNDNRSYEERIAERRGTQQVSVLGVSSTLGRFDNAEAESMLQRLTSEFSERERSIAARERRQAAELEEVNRRLQELDSQVAGAVDQMRAQMQEMERQQQRARRSGGGQEDIYDPVQTNSGQRFALTGDNRQYEGDIDAEGRVLRRPQTQIVTRAPQRLEGGVIRTLTQRDIREVRESGVVDVRENQSSALTARNQSVRRRGDAGEEVEAKPQTQQKYEVPEFTLAMGSIISGTTINGVAAPTNVGRHRDPIPLLMRVKREAVMPNFHTLDIRECFLLGSAIGDLGSSRVYVRAEAISCITESGEAIERNITAYAVSADDGMAGIPGTIIERSNIMIANTLKSGFLSGFAEAAAPQRIQTLNTSPTSSQVWQSQQMDRYATSGVLRGASSAMERIADYYMAMAESIWPVVELLPGIEVDFIVQRGMSLRLEGSQEVPVGHQAQGRGAH